MMESLTNSGYRHDDVPRKHLNYTKHRPKLNDTSFVGGKSASSKGYHLGNDGKSHSLESLSRLSYHRAEPNHYAMFSQSSRNPHTRESNMMMSRSDSYSASSEFSESKYGEMPRIKIPQMLPELPQRNEEQYLSSRPQFNNSNRQQFEEQHLYPITDGHHIPEDYCLSPERFNDITKTLPFRDISRYDTDASYTHYHDIDRLPLPKRSKDSERYHKSWEESGDGSNHGDFTLSSVDKESVHYLRKTFPYEDRYRNRSTASPYTKCWPNDPGMPYGHQHPSRSLGSTTTLTSYTDDSQPVRQQSQSLDHARAPRKHRMRSPPSIEELSSMNPYRQKKTSDHLSPSYRESNRHSRRSENKDNHGGDDNSVKKDHSSRQSNGKLSASGSPLNRTPPNFIPTNLSMDDIDLASLYGMTSRKMMGPILLGLLVLIMLLSLGLAIYFALGQSKEVDFSIANIRLRIINSTYGEPLDFLTKQSIELLSAGYCRELDQFYLQSGLKSRYRGCEVISLRQESINFTLYFKEKKISSKMVMSVIRSSVHLVTKPVGITALIDKLEVNMNDNKVIISDKKEKEDFDKIQVKTKPATRETTTETKGSVTTTATSSVTPRSTKAAYVTATPRGTKGTSVTTTRSSTKTASVTATPRSTKATSVTTTPRSTKGTSFTTTRNSTKTASVTATPRSTKTTSFTTTPRSTKATSGTNTRNSTTYSITATKKSTTAATSAITTPRRTANTSRTISKEGITSIKTTSTTISSTLKSSNVNKRKDSHNPCSHHGHGELVPHPTFCQMFFQCDRGESKLLFCKAGTWFDSRLKVCRLIPAGTWCTPQHSIPTSRSLRPVPPSVPPGVENRTESIYPGKNSNSSNNNNNINTTVETKRSTSKYTKRTTTTTPIIPRKTTTSLSEGHVEEPCTTSLNEQYHPHPNGCSDFTHCINGIPRHKHCPIDFIFDFMTSACVCYSLGIACSDFVPCQRSNKSDNYYPHPIYCDLYIQCDEFGNEQLRECRPGLVFNPSVKICTDKNKTNKLECSKNRYH